MRTIDVLIVGSGPSGMSTALHLIKLDPEWSNRLIVVDKAVHPREKLCGGGVSRFGVDILANLGLTFEPHHVPVNEIRIIFEKNIFSICDRPIVRITRRDEFDSWLVKCGEQRGIEVHQGEAVTDIIPHAEYIEVITESQTYGAKVVVAADGSSSFVKRKLRWGGRPQTARLLEILTPEVPDEQSEFYEGVAVFDFTPMMTGLQGYYWDFPTIVQGQPHMNRGVFDSRIRPEMPRVALKKAFEVELLKRGHHLDQYQLKGHPIHWFDKTADFCRSHVLLVGDAAGTDPLLGEGIPFALSYGDAAALEIAKAFEAGTFDFANYRRRILEHPLLKQLSRRASLARLLHILPKYPWLAKGLWWLTPVMFRLLAWYCPQYIAAEKPRMVRRESN